MLRCESVERGTIGVDGRLEVAQWLSEILSADVLHTHSNLAVEACERRPLSRVG